MIVSKSKAEEAARVLNLDLQGLTLERVNEHFRRYAKDCHPDYHGQAKLDCWARISWAKECLEHWLNSRLSKEQVVAELLRDACPNCGGSGRVPARKRGWGKPLIMMCDTCKGMGTILPEENDID